MMEIGTTVPQVLAIASLMVLVLTPMFKKPPFQQLNTIISTFNE